MITRATPSVGCWQRPLPSSSTTFSVVSVLDPNQQVSSTRYFLRELNRFGITSAIDAAGGSQQFPDNYAAVMQLARSGDLGVRIAYHLLPQTAGRELQDLAQWAMTMRMAMVTNGCASTAQERR